MDIHKDRIREIFLANGFTIKEGQFDLKPYVYEAAEALLRESYAMAGMGLLGRANPSGCVCTGPDADPDFPICECWEGVGMSNSPCDECGHDEGCHK